MSQNKFYSNKLRFDIFHNNFSKHKKLIIAAAAILFAAVICFLLSDMIFGIMTRLHIGSDFTEVRQAEAAIYFPDAGNAGCAVVKTPNAVIMIDCGREKAQLDIIAMLDSMGIDTIDLAVLTHPDSDHVGDYENVIRNKNVKRFVTCEYSDISGNDEYCKIKDTLIEKGITPEYAQKGSEYIFKDTILKIISPNKIYNDSNNNSLVLKLEYGNMTALFAGDITAKAERDILAEGADIGADIFAVPHHGSAGAVNEDFFRAVSPQIAVIQTQESRFLPSGEAISLLSDMGCEIKRTDEENGVLILWNLFSMCNVQFNVQFAMRNVQ